MRRMVLVLAAVLALALPSQAFADWSWGWGYISSSNVFVASGYAYWYSQYLDKESGDQIFHGWQHTDGTAVIIYAGGYPITEWYYASDYGFGGYDRNYIHYDWGARSYLYMYAVNS